MNPREGKSESSRGLFLKGAGVSIGCLIIGSLLGIAVDAKYRPNHILLYINADSKVSVSPQPGDTISFATDGNPTGTNIKINFTRDLRPCQPNSDLSDPTCVYAPYINGPNLYLYSCALGQPPNSCYDPQLGPKCSGCPTPGPKLNFVEVVLGDVKGLFGLLPRPRLIPETPSVPPGGISVPGLPVTSSARPALVQEYVAGCDSSNKPAVHVIGSTTPMTPPIVAEPGDTITWTLYPPPNSYQISGLDAVCTTGSSPSSAGTQFCIIKGGSSGNIPYTLNMACGASTSTAESISIK
jgi:hypothetical protein